jgi:ring-1,2-phenylacetyl-CoA epoxidase subunit PaaD
MVTAWTVAADTPDPELPMLTLADLGILRDVTEDEGHVVATITPTYSGCPAMREMSHDLRYRLQRAGFARVTVRTQLAPPWTTDWITPAGHRKLSAAGIAPPNPAGHRTGPIPLTLAARTEAVACPRCGSVDTRQIAAFSATACRSLHRCTACSEPFESVKSI